MLKERDTKIDNLIGTAMKSLNNLIDVNTVIGKPINTADGTVIIPVSKVTMGFVTGGGEYGEIKVLKKDKNYPFGGGSGAVLSMKPYGFLIDNGKGFKLVSANNEPLEKIIDSAQELLSRMTKNDEEI
jgi:sporulation protein YtfJ